MESSTAQQERSLYRRGNLPRIGLGALFLTLYNSTCNKGLAIILPGTQVMIPRNGHDITAKIFTHSTASSMSGYGQPRA